MIEKIEECVASGMSFEDTCASTTAYMKKAGLVFMLKFLKSFANNGRVSPIVAKLVGIAGICIVGKASEEGTLAPMHKPRSVRPALETIVQCLESEGFRSGKISIGHTQNEAAAEQLKKLIPDKFKNAKIEIHRFNVLCSFYAENGGVLVAFEKE